MGIPIQVATRRRMRTLGQTLCLGLLLIGCVPNGPTPPPAIERLHIDGSADPTRPILLRWDPVDPGWGRIGVVYRIRARSAPHGTPIWEQTGTKPSIQLPAGLVPTGSPLSITVEAGDGSPRTWSHPRSLTVQSGPDLDGDGIEDRLESRITRTFAPQLRFNRRVTGDTSHQNRDEIFFPTSIRTLERWLHSEWVPQVDPDTGKTSYVMNPWGHPFLTFPSHRARSPFGHFSDDDDRGTTFTGRPGNERASENRHPDLMRAHAPDGQPIAGRSHPGMHIDGIPENLPGDLPSQCTLYTHVYPISKSTHPTGIREEHYGVEYWIFYAQDTAGRLNTGRIGLSGLTIRTGGHIGDWEHVSYEIVRECSSSGREIRLDLVRGVYYGHGYEIDTPRSQIRFVPGTQHPRVYISWGKHASYPAPGIWRNEAPFYDDIFHGNGVTIETWNTQLLDLGERQAIRAPCAWAAFEGRWGQTDLFGLASSPTGPMQKGSWGSLVSQWTYTQWAQQLGIKLD